MSCGMTGKIFAPPERNMSSTPFTARNRYGSSFSRTPSKKMGR